MERKNCWEIILCGREKTCPAYPNNGRQCFVVTGTSCRGETQGSYGDKIEKCRKCKFYEELTTGGRPDLW